MESRGVVRCKDADLWPTNGQGRDFMRPRAKQLRMTRMHFEAIAETLASLRPTVVAEGQTTGAAAYAQWAETVQKFADLCASSNNLFRADTFRRACTVED